MNGPATVAILGVGLIGGSLGMALRARRAVSEVVGWDRNPEAVGQGLARGVMDRAAHDAADAVSRADLVVLAVPVQAIIPLLASTAPHLPPNAVVTDVGSAKARIVREAEAILGGRFVGGHPMAGSEESGVGAASADLFEGAAWALTPTPRTTPEALARVETLVRSVGAVPRRCDPKAHDRFAAYLSHLPHLLAYGLARTAAAGVTTEFSDLAAGSFRSGTRVARSDPAFWAAILQDNHAAVLEALRQFTDWTRRVEMALQQNNSDALTALLAEAHDALKPFPR